MITEVKVKKVLSAEEHAMRRAEMARRRKNLSEKRKEEEKVCSPFHVQRSSCHIRFRRDFGIYSGRVELR